MYSISLNEIFKLKHYCADIVSEKLVCRYYPINKLNLLFVWIMIFLSSVTFYFSTELFIPREVCLNKFFTQLVPIGAVVHFNGILGPFVVYCCNFQGRGVIFFTSRIFFMWNVHPSIFGFWHFIGLLINHSTP